MRVLVVSIPLPTNRFLVDLNQALREACDLTHDPDAFWEMRGQFDVVHLHFPEYLTYAHQDAYREGFEPPLQETERRLRHWAERARIVVTRHVLLPHDALEDPHWESMYATVYRYADAVVHFAESSIEEFSQRYATLPFHRGMAPRHAVIPHHNYESLPNEIGRDSARELLGIDRRARVMLAFGSIRNEAERALILRTFKGLRLRRKLLLVSRWPERLADVPWIRMKYWLRDVQRAWFRLHLRYHFNYGFVEETDAQLYLNAADILFIPRLRVLNSGNVTLGMTFGRVVVGPDSWDVGELLKGSGNPVFDPERPETAVAAVADGFRLAEEGTVGPANRALALKQWSVVECADRYVRLFGSLISSDKVNA